MMYVLTGESVGVLWYRARETGMSESRTGNKKYALQRKEFAFDTGMF